MMRKVLIYRSELLPFSETFILSQLSMLRRFQPVLAGMKRVENSLDVAPNPVLTLTTSETPVEKLKRRLFLLTGYSGRFLTGIKAHKPELVHAHFAVDACAVLPIVRRLRLPLIVTLHGYDVTRRDLYMRRWPATRAYLRRREALWKQANLLLCVSEQLRRHALQQGFPEDKLIVHHIGVNLAQFTPAKERPHRPIVLFVGRLVEKKGCIHLIRAMQRVKNDIPSAQLVIAGDGPLRAALESEAERLLHNYVFVGRLSHQEVRRWMGCASVLAVPSIQAKDGDSEGLPSVICEAMAAGVPVAAFAGEGASEALPEPLRSRLPAEGDDAGFADLIQCFLGDEKEWRHASVAGRCFVEKKFDLERQTQTLEEIYDEVIARHNG